MYYVIQKNHILNLFFSFGQNMKKIMMVKEKNVLLKCIEMQDLYAIFFNSSIFIIFLCKFWKKKSE
jgi:hypothetical protein